MERLRQLYTLRFGQAPQDIVPLAKAGSNRQYFRLAGHDGASVVGVVGNNLRENAAFIYLTSHFSAMGLPMPEVLAVSDDEQAYLQTDFGGTGLYDALCQGRASGQYSDDEVELLRRTLRALPHVQVKGGMGLDVDRLLTPSVFDYRSVMFDLNYFKYCFLRLIDAVFDEIKLEDDFERLVQGLVACGSEETTFLYRDFQARNVMLVDGQPHFIDFQGGRIGPVHYDVASFLWQASAGYPPALREQLVDEYLDELATLMPVDPQRFRDQLRRFVLFRQLQVLGAYGLRGLYEQKPYFVRSIPAALNNVADLVEAGVVDTYPTLRRTLIELRNSPVLQKIID